MRASSKPTINVILAKLHVTEAITIAAEAQLRNISVSWQLLNKHSLFYTLLALSFLFYIHLVFVFLEEVEVLVLWCVVAHFSHWLQLT